ncbi:MAG: M23 family metallopeptidase [Actinomycetota bacterium]
MRAPRRLLFAAPAVVAFVAVGCGTVTVEVTGDGDDDKIDVERADATAEPSLLGGPDSDPATASTSSTSTTSTSTTLSSSPTTSAAATTTSSTTTVAPMSTTAGPATTTTTVAPTIPLEYHDTGYDVFALAGDLEVRMPVSRYEMVGFHESGHDGAFQLQITDLTDWRTLASRGRGTGSRTAADIVAPVDEPVMAPIDGTVIRAGSYTLYCDHTDDFVVIEPAGRPGWELKIFHFDGRVVDVGDEVVASTTMIATSGRVLPFVSQVDEFTAEPSNPHVHIEVIDTSIPDRPSTGGGC